MGIDAAHFHTLYQKCFIDPITCVREEPSLEVKEKLLDLLTISLENSETKMFETISTIRSLFTKSNPLSTDHPTLERLKIFSRSVENGEAFWLLFSKKIPFESAKPIQKLWINRFKALGEELGRLKINDRNALQQFLENSEYFTPPAVPSRSNTNKQESHVDIVLQQNYSNETIPDNIYSEKMLQRLHPEMISQIRSIRNAFCIVALQGNLITKKIIVERGSLTGIPRILLVDYDPKNEKSYPIVTTLMALIYSQIEADRIHSRDKAFVFMCKQLKENPTFSIGNTEIDQKQLIAECIGLLNQFDEIFAAMKNKADQKQNT